MSEINEIAVMAVGNELSRLVIGGPSFPSSFFKNMKERTDKYYNNYFVKGLYETVLDEYIDTHKGNFSNVDPQNRVYYSISLKDSSVSKSAVIFYKLKDQDGFFANDLGTLVKDAQLHRIFLVFDASVVDIDSIVLLDLDVNYRDGQVMIDDRIIRQSDSEFHLNIDVDEHIVDEAVSDAFDNGHRDYYMVSMSNSIAAIFDHE